MLIEKLKGAAPRLMDASTLAPPTPGQVDGLILAPAPLFIPFFGGIVLLRNACREAMKLYDNEQFLKVIRSCFKWAEKLFEKQPNPEPWSPNRITLTVPKINFGSTGFGTPR